MSQTEHIWLCIITFKNVWQNIFPVHTNDILIRDWTSPNNSVVYAVKELITCITFHFSCFPEPGFVTTTEYLTSCYIELIKPSSITETSKPGDVLVLTKRLSGLLPTPVECRQHKQRRWDERHPAECGNGTEYKLHASRFADTDELCGSDPRSDMSSVSSNT